MPRHAFLICVAALALPLAGCAGGEQVYPLAPDEAASRLHNLDDAGFSEARRCGVPIGLSAQSLDAATIKWAITSDGAEVAAFSLKVEPAGNGGSRVIIALPKDPAGGEIYDGSQHYEHPVVQQPLRPALEELVAAALEGRRFDPARVKGGNGDDVCVLQRQTSGPDKLRLGGRAAARPAGGASVDAWGTPQMPTGSDFGNASAPAGAAPAPVDPNPAAPGSGAVIGPPPPDNVPAGQGIHHRAYGG
jgi:hypothetical protein